MTLLHTNKNVTCKTCERSLLPCTAPRYRLQLQEALSVQQQCDVEKNVTQEERTGIVLD